MDFKKKILLFFYTFFLFLVFMVLATEGQFPAVFGGRFFFKYFVEKTFGLSFLFFVFLGFLIAFVYYRGVWLKLLNDSLTLISLFFSFFFLNVLLLNTEMINTPWAGLFPLIFHSVVLNYVGQDFTRGVIIVELFLVMLFFLPVYRVLNRKFFINFSIINLINDFIKKGVRDMFPFLKKTKVQNSQDEIAKSGEDNVYTEGGAVKKLKNRFFLKVPKEKAFSFLPKPGFLGVAKMRVNSVGGLSLYGDKTPKDSPGLKSAMGQESDRVATDAFLKVNKSESLSEDSKNEEFESDTESHALKIKRLNINKDHSNSGVDSVSEERHDQLPLTDETPSPYETGSVTDMPTSHVDIDLSSISFKSTENSEGHIEPGARATPDFLHDIFSEDFNKPKVFNAGQDGKHHFDKASVTLLDKVQFSGEGSESDQFIQETAEKLKKVLKDFGIIIAVEEVATGPVITRYEISIEPGTKISKIVNLSDNIAMSLAAPSIRIVAPIPGKSVIGIEVPNHNRETVLLREIVESKTFQSSQHILPIALGKSILGEPVIADLAATPHLLIAGATGSGKSVCINSIISSLLFNLSPDELRFIMIDPKMVELTVYNDIPHLLSPVIVNPKEAAKALHWIINEMEARYTLLEKFKVRNINSYNRMIREEVRKKGHKEDNLGTLPYIVLVIDEFADLMMVAKKEVEDSVIRLAAMSRAVGIHLILGTQRPSVDVITGIIKANFPSRIAFQVSSRIDSRTILDSGGADKLLGKGDMLFQMPTSSMPERIQGTFLSDQEVGRIVSALKKKNSGHVIMNLLDSQNSAESRQTDDEEDELFNEAVQVILQDKKASASYLQRRLKIGYNRAARIVEKMEEMEIVGQQAGSKPREVLISSWP